MSSQEDSEEYDEVSVEGEVDDEASEESEPIPSRNLDNGRRRVSNPSLWKRNYQKSRRAEGKSYYKTTRENPERVVGKNSSK